MNSRKSKPLGLAGLVLVLEGISTLFPNNLPAQDVENVVVESEYTSPKIIATFEYESNRPEYEGQMFQYHLWSDGKISQADPKVEPEPKFSQRCFYDINNDEQFGKAELDAMKDGTLIYMHPEFNEIVNNLIAEKLKSGEHSQKVIDNYRKLCAELYNNREKKVEKNRIPERESKKNLWSVIAGVNGARDFWEGLLGLRYEPIENLGFSIMAKYGLGSNKTISEITTPTSPSGIYGKGKIEEIDRSLRGIGGEFQLGPLIFGGGVNNWRGTLRITEDLIKNDQLIKSDSNSKANSETFGYFNVGLEFKLGKKQNFGLGVNSYFPIFSEQKPYTGIRTSLKLNNPKRNYPSNKYNRNR